MVESRSRAIVSLLKQCVLGLFLGAGPVFLLTARVLEKTLENFLLSRSIEASTALGGVILLVIEQGYVWDDAQKHLRERLLKAARQPHESNTDGEAKSVNAHASSSETWPLAREYLIGPAAGPPWAAGIGSSLPGALVSDGTQGHESTSFDSSSIEVNRRARRSKSVRLDLAGLLSLLARYVHGDRHAWRVVRVPTRAAEDAPPPLTLVGDADGRSDAPDQSVEISFGDAGGAGPTSTGISLSS